ncbi:MAG: alanine dehydrogenase [Chitinophagales bacterium]|nr:alanine dehydrogenase [Chitinophagales bacterium]
MSTQGKKFEGITKKLGLLPQEQVALAGTKDGKLFIGLPRERTFEEKRIGLTPDAVELLIANGHQVIVEHDAGKACGFFDYMYSEAGAEITKNTEEVFKANIVIKVAPPTLFEIELMQPGHHLISPIHMPSITKEYLYALMKKKINAIAYEFLRDESGNYPFVSAMSEIAGSNAVLIGAELLSNAHNGKGLLLGGISGVPPAKVVIIGAGVVGTFASRAAIGLGALVSIFDNDVHRLSDLQNNIGQRVFNSVITPEVLKRELEQADLLIGAVHSKTGRTPVIVSEEMITSMKAGSVVVDVSIDQGGCFETSEMTTLKKPTFVKHEVIHYCVPNIPSRVSQTASYAFSHLLTPILFKAHEHGGMESWVRMDRGTCLGLYTYNGHLTQRNLSQIFDIKFTNLDLIFSAGI